MTEESKREIIERAERAAKEAQIRLDTCSCSTLYGLSTQFDFISAEMVAATRALSGGVAASSGSCGALCSGLLALGVKHYPSVPEELSGADTVGPKMQAAWDKVFRLRDAFLNEYGSTLCSGVQKAIYGRSYNLLDEKEREEFLTLPGHREKCAQVVAKATRLTAEMLLEDE